MGVGQKFYTHPEKSAILKKMDKEALMKHRNLKALYSISIISILLILVIALALPGQDLRLAFEEPPRLNEGWMISSGDSSEILAGEETILPVRLPVEPETPLVLERTLDSTFSDSQSLLIRGSLQNLVVSMDNEVIYERVFSPEENGISLPMVSSWNIIEIPEQSDGKALSITLSSPFAEMSGQINSIHYGNNNHLLLYLIRTHGPGLITTGLIFLVGLALTLSPLVLRRIDSWEMAAVGLFALFISLYLLAEGRMLQFFTGNQFLLGSLAYVTQSLFPIPLLLYFQEVTHHRYRLVFNVLIGVFSMNLMFMILLQLSGQQAFFESLWMTHGILVLGIVASIHILIKEVRESKNEDAKKLLQSLSVMVFFGSIELIHFYFIDRVQTSAFIRVGILLFVILLSYQSFQRFSGILAKSLQADLYQKLAYTDRLTNAPNRMAFERDLKTLFQDEAVASSETEKGSPIINHDRVTIGIFDLNNLKEINDSFGHKYGDSAIINTYETLKEVFSESGECYRIGGDEFACFIKAEDHREIDTLKELLNQRVKEKAEGLFYPFVIAQGYSTITKDEKIDLERIIHRADREMYRDKESKKTGVAVKV